MSLDRLIDIVRESAASDRPRFPPTEIFNEGWMLRLVLDAAERLKVKDHPLEFKDGAQWFSEALLLSPFRPRMRSDKLGEGFTNADAVVGHFLFNASTKAGLRIRSDATQLVVFEAKMFSNLSKGTTNAPEFDQAARNVACMAEAIAMSGRALPEFQTLGFFVVAPIKEKRSNAASNLEQLTNVDSIRRAVANRIAGYEAATRSEAIPLRRWERDNLLPLIDLLASTGRLAVLSWEDCIAKIAEHDPRVGAELHTFYEHCLTFVPTTPY
jgi:hypothetical protein